MFVESLAFDSDSVRRFDENGNLHVKMSHLTKVQVRPYYGFEVIGYKSLNLDPQKVYYGYCPAEELSKASTIESVNGIPIQLDHHPDYADNPAIKTRVGSTGTDGAFRYPYLDNSLHIQNEDAIKRIKDGSMRQLSLAYRYKPDFSAHGETPDGQKYDFVMRDISANHVALVEEGRAGPDVLVADHSLQVNADMNENEKPIAKDADNPAVEQKEVDLAETIEKAAQGIKDLHTEDATGHVEDKPAPDAAEDENPVGKLAALLAARGLKPEDAKAVAEMAAKMFAPQAEDTDECAPKAEAEDSDEEAAPVDLAKSEAEDGDEEAPEPAPNDENLIADAIRQCGYDEEPEEVQRAFAEGVRYGEKKEKDEPKKLDREHESEGMEKALGQDAAIKRAEERAEKRIMARFTALDEVSPILGKVKATAFDSAADVYLAALKQEGFKTSNIAPDAAQSIFRAYIAGKNRASRKLAQDAKPKANDSALFNKISKIKTGV